MYFSSARGVGLAGIWLLTGPPGVGKSTALSKVVLRLKSAGVIVGGFTTSEQRSGGTRIGFAIRDLTTGRSGQLASASARVGPRVGRYRVNLEDLAKVGAAGLDAAAERSELIVIDEVGPMELVSPEFRRAVKKCVESAKPLLAVVHERLDDDILNELRSKATSVFSMTVETRDQIVEELGTILLDAVGGTKLR
jgi:nucleoside-triphosphatase